jgi:hypothetical protein
LAAVLTLLSLVVVSMPLPTLLRPLSSTSSGEDDEILALRGRLCRLDLAERPGRDKAKHEAGVLSSKGDKLGQQYQTPQSAVGRGADFIISGRGIYAWYC